MIVPELEDGRVRHVPAAPLRRPALLLVAVDPRSDEAATRRAVATGYVRVAAAEAAWGLSPDWVEALAAWAAIETEGGPDGRRPPCSGGAPPTSATGCSTRRPRRRAATPCGSPSSTRRTARTRCARRSPRSAARSRPRWRWTPCCAAPSTSRWRAPCASSRSGACSPARATTASISRSGPASRRHRSSRRNRACPRCRCSRTRASPRGAPRSSGSTRACATAACG